MTRMDPRDRLTQLYRDHWRALFGYSCRRCGSTTDAAEVVSEVFLVAWRRIDEIPQGDDGRLWLYGVARLTLANQLRAVRRRDRLGSLLLSMVAENHGRDPADLILRGEQDDQVRRAMEQLSDTDRELLRLIAWEALTPTAAAQVLGLSAATTRVRLSRARRRLTVLLHPEATAEPGAAVPLAADPPAADHPVAGELATIPVYEKN